MGLTIEEALTFGGLSGAQVIAGRDRLHERIESVAAATIDENGLIRQAAAGQLTVAGFSAIKGDLPRQEAVTRSLAAAGCCGLVVLRRGRRAAEPEPELAGLCDSLGLPLLVSATGVRAEQIIEPILLRLSNFPSPESAPEEDAFPANDSYQSRYREFLADLLLGQLGSGTEALSQGLELGLDLSQVRRILLAKVWASDGGGPLTENWYRDILADLKAALRTGDRHSQVFYRSNTLIILLHDIRDSLAASLGENILALLNSRAAEASLGLSQPFQELEQLPQAYQQAWRAATAGQELSGPGQLTSYDQIWFVEHLRSLSQDPAAQRISGQLLEPLRKYDQAQNTELTETLRLLLWHDNDVLRLSKIMYLHRNTILYRKNKIIEVLGYSPFEMPHMLNFIAAFAVSP